MSETYRLTFRTSARKELERLDTPILRRVATLFDSLQSDPRPPSCKKLVGYPNLWRTRIGDYRILYEIHDEQRLIVVVAIRHRSDAYR